MQEAEFRIVLSTDAAWAAGFLDGEGWFGITGRGETPAIEAAQTATDAPLLKLQELFGGSVSRKATTNCWKLNSAPAVRAALVVLIPHLLVKREQAEILLRYACLFHGRGTQRIEPELRALRSVTSDELAATRTRRAA